MHDSALVPYDVQWPRLFEAEREILEGVLAPWLRDGIHHIGSTAVAGLAGTAFTSRHERLVRATSKTSP